MPVVKVEVYRFFALTVQAVSVAVADDGINEQGLLVGHAKVERRYVYGYGDADVVGVYLRLCRLLLGIADSLRASGEPITNNQ